MKFLFSVLLAVVSVGFINSANAFDIGADCVPQSEMRAIANHFTQFSNLANADYCNDNSKNWHLVSSIVFMRKTQFSQTMKPSKDELFTGRFAKNWYDYFIGRINRLEVVGDCPKGVIAYVYSFGDKTMYTCPAALTTSFSSLDRASVMMHEARHIDGFPHMTCTKGARKGIQGACDVKIADGGSYAITVETYAQLAKFAEGIHPALKSYAKSSAVIYADEAFENPVKINRTENLLALTNNLDFHSINIVKNETKKLGQVSALGQIVRRGQHMILFPNDKTLKAQYVFSNNEGELDQSPSDFITEYNAQTPEQKANLVDLHIGAQWSARVYKNKVTFACDPRAPTTNDLQTPNGLTAVSLIYPDGYARDKYTALITTVSGEVLEAGCVNKQASLKLSNVNLDQKYSRIQKAGGQVFGITADGKLYKLEAGRSTPVITALDGSIVEIVPQQSFEFFE
ncbi:MAG: hypothetical protein AABY53_07725 [Bdellovibrionota bacterium]